MTASNMLPLVQPFQEDVNGLFEVQSKSFLADDLVGGTMLDRFVPSPSKCTGMAGWP